MTTNVVDRASINSSRDLLVAYDKAPLNRRYWTIYAILTAGTALDYFDLFVVGYLVAVVGPQWHLTYGQSSLILLTGGLGAIFGALIGGSLGDKFGRKTTLVANIFLVAIASGSISLVPDGAWELFAFLRFVVGFALGGTVTPFNALLVEFTPTRYRTVLSSLSVVSPTVGGLLASLSAATLLGALGWRGLAALGIAPAVIGVLVIFLVPESVRWLVSRRRFDEARSEVARMQGVAAEKLPLPTIAPAAPPRGSLVDLYARPGLFWLTVIAWVGAATGDLAILLWGPTIFAMLFIVPVRQAAGYMVYLTLFGIVGKVAFSFLAQKIGRRYCGMVHGFAGALVLVAAACFHSVVVAGFPIFALLVMLSYLFVAAAFVNIAPYSIEAYGVKLGSRAAGLGQASNGIGKILGPLSLAVIAGTGNLLTPAATEAAVFPTFMFLAVCTSAVGLVFAFLAEETHGIPILQGDEQPTTRAAE